MLEERAARHALPLLDDEALARIEQAAADCAQASERDEIAAELAANRRFHFGILESAERPHTLRLIAQLWDSTEAYRALYYNSAEERRVVITAHGRILAAVRSRDADLLVSELNAHRQRALKMLRGTLRR